MRYLFGDYVLDTQCPELHSAGAPIKLRHKVFQVLVYLLVHRDRVVSKQEFLEQLWPDQFVGDEVLKVLYQTLRRALGERGRPRVSCARCTARAIASWRQSRCGSTARRTRCRPPSAPPRSRTYTPGRGALTWRLPRRVRTWGAPLGGPGRGIQTGHSAVRCPG